MDVLGAGDVAGSSSSTSSSVAPGAIALGGVGGCVSVLSKYGTQLASMRPVSLED